jgi:hypothetical protein
MSWTYGGLKDKEYISYLKGKSNKVCVFNTNTDFVAQGKDYSDLFD